MPKRNRDRTIQGSDLQGADSFVKVKIISVEEALDMQTAPLVISEEATDEERAKLESDHAAATERNAREKLCQYVLDWNWVDDDGVDLPKPHGNPDVFKKLTGQEIKYLA